MRSRSVTRPVRYWPASRDIKGGVRHARRVGSSYALNQSGKRTVRERWIFCAGEVAARPLSRRLRGARQRPLMPRCARCNASSITRARCISVQATACASSVELLGPIQPTKRVPRELQVEPGSVLGSDACAVVQDPGGTYSDSMLPGFFGINQVSAMTLFDWVSSGLVDHA